MHNPELSPLKGTKLIILGKSERHDLLLNPLPFNIQNPYILKEMQKRGAMNSNPSFRTLADSSPYPQAKRNNIFG